MNLLWIRSNIIFYYDNAIKRSIYSLSVYTRGRFTPTGAKLDDRVFSKSPTRFGGTKCKQDSLKWRGLGGGENRCGRLIAMQKPWLS